MNQTTALDILRSGENVFITGSAGTGKTYLLNQFIEYLKERRVTPAIVAPTGIAASHLRGQTIHSYFSLGIRDTIDDGYIEFLMEKRYLAKRFSKLKILIIDEVSMISPEIFSSMDQILRAFKGTTQPFGGIQVVLSGDFFQLPPVSKVYKEKRFAWQSPVWRELNLKTSYLEKKFRQVDDKLITVLDEIRSGQVSKISHDIFNSRYHKVLNIDFTPTKLYTHNIDVDRINDQELANLPGRPIFYTYESKGSQKNIAKIFKSSLVLEELTLKKDAVVLFIKNSPEKGYINGTTGIVTGFDPNDNMPIVKISSGRRIKLEQEDWSIENDSGTIIATISQVPLRLAWAITIHKSQGMTLDAAEIDLTKTFEAGQGYVALSRIKTIEGLRLMGLNDMALRVDPLILHIDDRIKMASQRAADEIVKMSKRSLEILSTDHIESLGGITDKIQIEAERENLKNGKVSVESYRTPTQIKTKHLIEKSKDILELAKMRGLSKSTIIQHLGILREADESLDLEKFKPDEEIFRAVRDEVVKLKSKSSAEDFSDDGRLRLKPIFDAMDGEVSYDDIRISLLFLKEV
ncbi:MAG: AAA family ATPase [Campylobacterota bacterium]|nr:AAA family ATPase [Campylobacterota bacterium]